MLWEYAINSSKNIRKTSFAPNVCGQGANIETAGQPYFSL